VIYTSPQRGRNAGVAVEEDTYIPGGRTIITLSSIMITLAMTTKEQDLVFDVTG